MIIKYYSAIASTNGCGVAFWALIKSKRFKIYLNAVDAGASRYAFPSGTMGTRHMLTFLAEHPDIGMNRKELGDFYQSYLIGSHIVFFRAYKEKIKIIRVLHQRMDAVLHFGN